MTNHHNDDDDLIVRIAVIVRSFVIVVDNAIYITLNEQAQVQSRSNAH